MIAIPENRFTGVTLLVLLFSLSMFFCTDEAVVPNDARSVDTLYISSKGLVRLSMREAAISTSSGRISTSWSGPTT